VWGQEPRRSTVTAVTFEMHLCRQMLSITVLHLLKRLHMEYTATVLPTGVHPTVLPTGVHPTVLPTGVHPASVTPSKPSVLIWVVCLFVFVLFCCFVFYLVFLLLGFLLFFFFLFLNKGFLCSPRCPGAHCCTPGWPQSSYTSCFTSVSLERAVTVISE